MESNAPTARSEKQREASRRNGALSRGPVTEEGKAASSRNSLRHGMLAKVAVFDGESEESFHSLLSSLEEIFQPNDVFESTLIETMAMARWRLLRIVSIERAGMKHHQPDPSAESDPAARAFTAFRDMTREKGVLELIARYESRCDRQYERAVETLRKYRRDRRKLRELDEKNMFI